MIVREHDLTSCAYISNPEFSHLRPLSHTVANFVFLQVKERDLAEALRDGTIAAAGLDVYEKEPAIDPLLIELENVRS